MNRYLCVIKSEKYSPVLDDWYVSEHDTYVKTQEEVEQLLSSEYWESHGVKKAQDRIKHLNDTGELTIECSRWASKRSSEKLTLIKL